MIAATQRVRRHDPLLLPDRDEPYCLHDVWELIADGSRGEIVLDFGDSSLQFRVDPNTDEIGCRFDASAFAGNDGYHRVGSSAPWRRYLNEPCGWTWLAVNQQGYWDTVLISFDSVVPNVLLNAMASSLYVFTIGPMEKQVFDDPVDPVKVAEKKPRKKKRK